MDGDIETRGGTLLSPIPNPGSDKARELGCICPVLDNAHGRGYMGQEAVFIRRTDCPLHGGLE